MTYVASGLSRTKGARALEREPLRRAEMIMYTRREFGKIALASLATVRLKADATMVRLKPDATYGLDAAAINSTFGGVHVGAQTYSFRDLPHAPGGDAIDNVIKALVDSGVGECELWATQLEPQFPTGARGRRGDPPS